MRVVEVDEDADGALTVYVVTAEDAGSVCPGCGTRAHSCKETVAVTVRDTTFGDRALTLVWHKRRWVCPQPACAVRTFAEALPAVTGPRRRTTGRLRRALAAAVADSGRDVAEVAASYQVAWHTVHAAFVTHADAVLAAPLQPVRVLGIDEVRRGRARYTRDPDTAATTTVADRWHTGFTDLCGEQGILGHVEGRSKRAVIAWLRRQPADWLARIQLVATDLCAAFRAAVRTVLPHAALCADPFHLVHAANRMLGQVRRRLVRAHYGRRTRKSDPEYGIKRLLLANLEDLTEAQFDTLFTTVGAHAHLTDLALAWMAKEYLRDLLELRPNRSGILPTQAEVDQRFEQLQTWCAAHRHIPELAGFAQTLTRWRTEIVNTVLTGASNAASEGVNRIQKLDARAAFGYRNPVNQQRRARIASLRSRQRAHRRNHAATGTVLPSVTNDGYKESLTDTLSRSSA